MESSPKQQTTTLIQKAQSILLLTHQRPDGDAIGSLLGFYLILKKLKKDVQAVASNEIPNLYHFLPFHEEIKNKIIGLREFIINLDCKNSKVDKLGYKLENDILKIVIMPKGDNFKKEDLKIEYGAFHFDLIIALDTPDLERLGQIYDDYPDI